MRYIVVFSKTYVTIPDDKEILANSGWIVWNTIIHLPYDGHLYQNRNDAEMFCKELNKR